MAVPKSFSAFQRLFEGFVHEASGEPINPDLPDPGLTDTDDPRETPDRSDDPGQGRKTHILSIAADALLADLHDRENLRDAVMNPIPNTKTGTLLLIVNPSLESAEELVDFIATHPRVKRFALGARKLIDGERIRAIKVEPVAIDDECTPPDEVARQAKEHEQDTDRERIGTMKPARAFWSPGTNA